MLQILSEIPIFVWPLFALLLVRGLRARKTDMVPLAVLLVLPAVFFTWSVFSFLSSDPTSIFLRIFCLSIGFFMGYLHMQKLKLRFDKQKRRIEVPGSWIPLILSMSIFTAKFAIGMIGALAPELNGLLLGLDLFATIISGIFVGRGVVCFVRYQTASQDSLEKN